MIEPILYDHIEEKNQIERDFAEKLSPEKSLIHTLNLMDFMASLKSPDLMESDENEWIVLEFRK